MDAVVMAGRLCVGAVRGATLELEEHVARLDGADIPLCCRLDRLVEEVVERLWDVDASVELEPNGELLVKFPHGVQAALNARAVITLAGAAEGPPHALQLRRPVVMAVDGEGFRLSHERFRRLSSLACLRLEGASLHPDGKVQLRGGARRGLDGVVRGGLERASARLSEIVRRSPRFARLRTFLKTGPQPPYGEDIGNDR